MPKFIMQNRQPSLYDIEVKITSGNDPIILVVPEEMRGQIIDIEKINDVILEVTRRPSDYNSKLLVFLYALQEIWPLRTPPSWNELLMIFNRANMLTSRGLHWLKPNLMQKLIQLDFNKDTIVNHNGRLSGIFLDSTPNEEVDNLKEFIRPIEKFSAPEFNREHLTINREDIFDVESQKDSDELEL